MALYRSKDIFKVEEFDDPIDGPLIRIINNETNLICAIFNPETFSSQYEEILIE